MKPIRINGIWDEGFVLDKYMEKSEYIGDDVFGYPRYKNTYTCIGKLLYSMKYNGHYDTSSEIVALCEDFLHSWLSDKNIDIILPVPPSLKRDIQPVFIIAELLANKLNIPYSNAVLTKITIEPIKNIPKSERNLNGTIKQLKCAKRECNILLIDDIYSTGQTATECVSILKNDALVKKVYYLAIAKTK